MTKEVNWDFAFEKGHYCGVIYPNEKRRYTTSEMAIRFSVAVQTIKMWKRIFDLKPDMIPNVGMVFFGHSLAVMDEVYRQKQEGVKLCDIKINLISC